MAVKYLRGVSSALANAPQDGWGIKSVDEPCTILHMSLWRQSCTPSHQHSQPTTLCLNSQRRNLLRKPCGYRDLKLILCSVLPAKMFTEHWWHNTQATSCGSANREDHLLREPWYAGPFRLVPVLTCNNFVEVFKYWFKMGECCWLINVQGWLFMLNIFAFHFFQGWPWISSTAGASKTDEEQFPEASWQHHQSWRAEMQTVLDGAPHPTFQTPTLTASFTHTGPVSCEHGRP